MPVWVSKRKQQEQERKRNAELNREIVAAYEAGYVRGLTEAYENRFSPNQIREVFGLPPIKESEENE